MTCEMNNLEIDWSLCSAPDVILRVWLGSKHQLNNQLFFSFLISQYQQIHTCAHTASRQQQFLGSLWPRKWFLSGCGREKKKAFQPNCVCIVGHGWRGVAPTWPLVRDVGRFRDQPHDNYTRLGIFIARLWPFFFFETERKGEGKKRRPIEGCKPMDIFFKEKKVTERAIKKEVRNKKERKKRTVHN